MLYQLLICLILSSFIKLDFNQEVFNVTAIDNSKISHVFMHCVSILGTSPGRQIGLNLKTPLYIGGVNQSLVRVAPSLGVVAGFHGCISQVCRSSMYSLCHHNNLNLLHLSEYQSSTDMAAIR